MNYVGRGLTVITLCVLLSTALSSQVLQRWSNEKITKIDWTNQKKPAIEGFVRPKPADYMKIIDEDRQIVRARITLADSITVDLTERPKDIDFYDSTVEVNRQGKIMTYNVGNLINHQALSLAHVAIVPFGQGAGLLICEYEGGAVGATEGFAVLRFSSTGIELNTLPLTQFGKVVLYQRKPELAEIWNALDDYIGSDADPRFYATRACHWKANGYACDAPRRKRGRFIPSDINDPGIEVRP